MISKQFLNELVQKKIIDESIVFSKDHKRQTQNEYDIFLSYSYHDKAYALKLTKLFERSGFSVYIDLNDNSIDRNSVSGDTAKKIASIMDKCKSLIYLYSKASSISKWCPWELGYVSGKKNFRCAKIPLVQFSNDTRYDKQEYLEMYPTIDYEKAKNSTESFFWVNESENKYVKLKEWINGKNPYIHD
jgi:hypothetical protein